MIKYLVPLLIILIVPTVYFIFHVRLQYPRPTQLHIATDTRPKPLGRSLDTSSRPLLTGSGLYGNVELTVRMGVSEELLKRFLCSLIRSAVVFWNGKYGHVLVILDEEDRLKNFPQQMQDLNLPLRFRFVYEDRPSKEESFKRLAREQERPYGYIRQLYSSFFMDKYTISDVIAWIDTDVVFTMPVLNETIIRNNKLIVKGVNNFDNPKEFGWVKYWWDYTTHLALGRPMVADFMSFFPVYLYPSTIRNCRQFIVRRLRTATFQDAFFRFAEKQVSSVNIILSYAYYFERELYEWHIDVGPGSLQDYNNKRLPKLPPLLQHDIRPEHHVTIHSRYFLSTTDPLEQGICYAQIAVGRRNVPHCKSFLTEPNMMLFEFQRKPAINHLGTWCRAQKRRACAEMLSERYKVFRQLFEKGVVGIETDGIRIVDEFARDVYDFECPRITYVPFRQTS